MTYSASVVTMIPACCHLPLWLLASIAAEHLAGSRPRCPLAHNPHLLPHTRLPPQPIMLGDAALANSFAQRMLARGVYVVGFSYPVVPRGKARIRVQLSAAHTADQLDTAITAFVDTGRELGVI